MDNTLIVKWAHGLTYSDVFSAGGDMTLSGTDGDGVRRSSSDCVEDYCNRTCHSLSRCTLTEHTHALRFSE